MLQSGCGFCGEEKGGDGWGVRGQGASRGEDQASGRLGVSAGGKGECLQGHFVPGHFSSLEFPERLEYEAGFYAFLCLYIFSILKIHSPNFLV